MNFLSRVKKQALSTKLVFYGVIALVPLIIPFLLGAYAQHCFFVALVYSVLALSWSLVAGQMGQFSLAHCALFGVGGYSSALLQVYLNVPPIFGLVIGGSMACLCGLLIGALSLRFPGTGNPYFIITTIGFAEVTRTIIVGEFEITHGTAGLRVAPLLWPSASKIWYCYLVLLLLYILLIVMKKITDSPVGLSIRAIKADEIGAGTVGIPVTRQKVLIFLLSSFFAGIVGSIYTHYIRVASPELVTLDLMFIILFIGEVGGTMTLFGPILGAFIYEILSESTRAFSGPHGEYRFIILCVLLILIIRFLPGGIWNALKSGIRKIETFFKEAERANASAHNKARS